MTPKKIKVLPLPDSYSYMVDQRWACLFEDGQVVPEMTLADRQEIIRIISVEENNLVEIPPVYNRDGRYFDRESKTVWQEIAGLAFRESRTYDFHERLRMFHYIPMSIAEKAAYALLISARVRLPKDMRERWDTQLEYESIKYIKEHQFRIQRQEAF